VVKLLRVSGYGKTRAETLRMRSLTHEGVPALCYSALRARGPPRLVRLLSRSSSRVPYCNQWAGSLHGGGDP
jgi:hypothetical protein